MGKNKSPSCIVIMIGLPLIASMGCYLIFAGLETFSVEIIRQAMSGLGFGWAEPAVNAWMKNTPQPTYGDEYQAYGGAPGIPKQSDSTNGNETNLNLPAADVINVGQAAYDGYEGPEGFYCGDLLSGAHSWITDCFGTPRPVGCTNPAGCFHPGIDFGVGHTKVKTPMSGKVVFAGILAGGWGYTIIIENHGKQVLMSHATVLMYNGEQVKPADIVGKIVNAGDVVMISGGDNKDTRDGTSTGAHLHFEFRDCYKNYLGKMWCAQAKDPMKLALPGQTETCNWYNTVSNPLSNTACTLDPYGMMIKPSN